ncbi:hypothetical protein [Actinocatenispora thailandica]|uniref:hypothetical protein n=1 Tax=Actinocatenispora thailandica TaxID=227318 RepID=UPI0019524E06|nr:hypothetical protein [Actinocatenispora thailandica]
MPLFVLMLIIGGLACILMSLGLVYLTLSYRQNRRVGKLIGIALLILCDATVLALLLFLFYIVAIARPIS